MVGRDTYKWNKEANRDTMPLMSNASWQRCYLHACANTWMPVLAGDRFAKRSRSHRLLERLEINHPPSYLFAIESRINPKTR